LAKGEKRERAEKKKKKKKKKKKHYCNLNITTKLLLYDSRYVLL